MAAIDDIKAEHRRIGERLAEMSQKLGVDSNTLADILHTHASFRGAILALIDDMERVDAQIAALEKGLKR